MNDLKQLARVASRVARSAGHPLERARGRNEISGRGQQPLLLFGGKSRAWREPGRILYRDEPLFRAAIDSADRLVIDRVGFSPTAAFGGDWLAPTWDEEVRSEIVCMSLAQIGLADLWLADGPAPSGSLGLGSGEVAAAYAAGALGPEDAVRLICAIANCLEHPSSTSPSFVVDASPRRAAWLCRTAPRRLEYAGELVPGRSHLHSSAEDADDNRAFLRDRVTIVAEHPESCRYHVTGAGFDEERFGRELAGVAARPARLPLYLCGFGGRVTEGFALDIPYWSWMVTSPCRLAEACAAAATDGFDRVAVLGSRKLVSWHAETARRAGKRTHQILSFPRDRRETESWPRTFRSLRSPGQAVRSVPAPALPPDPTSLDLADPAIVANPLPAYESLRRLGPVHYLPRHDFWIVLGHEEMKAACAQPALFSNQPYDFVDSVLIGADPPKHAAVRRVISRFFSAEALNRICAFAEPLADRLVRPRFDVVGDYAAPFARATAARLIGIDDEGVEAIVEAAEMAQDCSHPFKALTVSLDRLADRAEAYRRIHDESEGLFADWEVRSLVRFLWMAAITTNERVISCCAMRLLQDEELHRRLRDDRSLVGRFIEEVMRLHPPEHMLPRMTTAAATLGGVTIPAGAEVKLCTTAANRDPAMFEAPAEFRLDRSPNRHFSFGSGVHVCSGAALARRLIPIAVGALLDRPTPIRAIQPLAALPWRATVMTLVPTQLVIGA